MRTIAVPIPRAFERHRHAARAASADACKQCRDQERVHVELRGADLQDRARQMNDVLAAQAIKAAAERPRRA
ncbi:MAG: hypothetical protein ACJ8F2_19515 [Xanthobacteraceae bacterium]